MVFIEGWDSDSDSDCDCPIVIHMVEIQKPAEVYYLLIPIFVSVTTNMRYEGIQSNFAFKDFTPENLKKEAEALISVSLD